MTANLLTSTVFPDCVWIMIQYFSIGFLVAQLVKNPLASTGDTRDEGSIPWSGRSPGKGNGHLLQYSCLKNVMLWGAWRAAVHEVARVRHGWAHTHTHTHTYTKISLWNFKGHDVIHPVSCSQRPALCDTVDCSLLGSPVHHCLPRFAQIHIHWIFSLCCPLLLLPLVF